MPKFNDDSNDEDIFKIPMGIYCYTYVNGKQVNCPYWSKDTTKEEYQNGYCSYLKMGDWDINGISLLWDQCKECGIKEFEKITRSCIMCGKPAEYIRYTQFAGNHPFCEKHAMEEDDFEEMEELE